MTLCKLPKLKGLAFCNPFFFKGYFDFIVSTTSWPVHFENAVIKKMFRTCTIHDIQIVLDHASCIQHDVRLSEHCFWFKIVAVVALSLGVYQSLWYFLFEFECPFVWLVCVQHDVKLMKHCFWFKIIAVVALSLRV